MQRSPYRHRPSRYSAISVQGLGFLAALSLMGHLALNTPAGYSNSTIVSQLLPTPSNLNYTLDTAGNMHLSWSTVPGGSVTYSLDRETISTGTWSNIAYGIPTTNYTDTNFGLYRYRISSSAGRTNSAPSTPVPQPAYAIIDLGANEAPMFINNAGAVALQSTANGNYTYWSGGGVLPILGLSNLIGMNNSGQIIGTYFTNETFLVGVPVDNEGDQAVGNFVPFAVWSPSTFVAQPRNPPNHQFVSTSPPQSPGTEGPFSIALGTPAPPPTPIFSYDRMTITPAGISDSGGAYGNVSESFSWEVLNEPITQTLVAGDLDTYSVPQDYVCAVNTIGTSIPAHSGNFYSLSMINGNGQGIGASMALNPSDEESSWDMALFYLPGGGPPAYPPLAVPWVWCAYDGAVFHPLACTPTGIASNGTIVGFGAGGVALWTNFSNPVALTNGIAGFINCNNQIVAGGQIWQANQLSNLGNLLPDMNGWSYLSATNYYFYQTSNPLSRTAINDSGAIVGTATYSGTNSAIAQGSHGVLLWPVQVTLQKQGDSSPPTTGVLVKKGDTVQMALNPGLLNGTIPLTSCPLQTN